MAKHPTMRTSDGVWQVEVITARGGQSFRVRRLDDVTPPGPGWGPTGRLVRTIDEVRAIMGDAFGHLREDRSQQRMHGGR